jgi:acetolactate decarboxylase
MVRNIFLALCAVTCLVLAGLIAAAGIPGQTPGDQKHDVLYQVSTIDALMEGSFDGYRSVGDLKQHGDFGTGTFDRLDGELVAVDGRYLQIRSDGTVHETSDSDTVPFATVTFFEPDLRTEPIEADNVSGLITYLSSHVPPANQFHAIRLSGIFPHVRVRVPARQAPPYPRFAVALKNQSVFEFNNTPGRIIGFYVPDYMKGLNVPGYHLHFISDDFLKGGHILEITVNGTPAEIDYTNELFISLPPEGIFRDIDLSGDRQTELMDLEQSSR